MGVININISIFLTLTTPILGVSLSIYQTLHKVNSEMENGILLIERMEDQNHESIK